MLLLSPLYPALYPLKVSFLL